MVGSPLLPAEPQAPEAGDPPQGGRGLRGASRGPIPSWGDDRSGTIRSPISFIVIRQSTTNCEFRRGFSRVRGRPTLRHYTRWQPSPPL
jgi:hypothetical protein